MILHRHILNLKFTISRHRNILKVSGNEKKTDIKNYWKNILVEYFVLNTCTN